MFHLEINWIIYKNIVPIQNSLVRYFYKQTYYCRFAVQIDYRNNCNTP
jgi:hypothetical protein